LGLEETNGLTRKSTRIGCLGRSSKRKGRKKKGGDKEGEEDNGGEKRI